MRRTLILIAFLISGALSAQNLVINEADVDTPGIDNLEFVELYGDPGLALDNYVLVLYNGLSDAVYEAWDLDGYSLNAEGFFVLGSGGVANVDLVIDNNSIQNGPEAIALYEGEAANFPSNTPFTLDNLVDALVYGTGDADDPELLTMLEPGQPQVDENANGQQSFESMSRNPDGGAPFVTDTYVAQEPTPGFTNELQCDGGVVEFTATNETSIEVCVDLEPEPVTFTFTNLTPDADYYYVLTDLSDNIIELSSEASFDFTNAEVGSCRVYGLSAAGELNEATTAAGSPVTDIESSQCASLSSNFLTVNKVTCIPPNCDAGNVLVNGSAGPVVVCVNGNNTIALFSSDSEIEEDQYFYVIADQFGEIIEAIDFEEYDFGGFDEGNCFVYGVSVTGELDESTIAQGELVSQISSTDCVSVSTAVQVNKVECTEDLGCGDLFFSEYIEGTSNNKALEIYNPTPFVVDLSAYTIMTYNDGNVVPTNTLNLSGSLEPGDVYVIANSNAAPPILNVADITSNVTFFNGNDPVVLRNGGVAIDILGIIGENPGKNMPWEVDGGSGSMGEHTLVRKPEYTQGETNWELAQMEWEAYDQDTFTFLGEHATVPCNYPETPTLSFASEEIFVQEGNSITVTVNIAFPIVATDVEVVYSGGSATPDVDFEQNLPVELNFPEGDFQPLSFTINTIDDEELEGEESIVIELQEITDVEFQIASLVVTILPSDFEIPVYDIIEVSGNNETFVADSLNTYCELRGIVHGLNTNPDGVQFTLIDDTDGINVYHPENNFDYEVVEGDSVHVVGLIDQFSGLTQIIPDTIIYVASGFELEEPLLTSFLDESTESRMVEAKCMELVDPDQWTNQEPGFNVEISDGNTTHTMRIDADSDIFGTDAPIGVFSVFGIGGQFDSSEPYDSGYQFSPRYAADITEPVYAEFSVVAQANEDEPVTFTNNSAGASGFSWDFGDGTTPSQEDEPTHTFTEPGTYTVELVAFAEDGVCEDTFTVEIVIDPVGINEQGNAQVLVYPNPASSLITVEGLINVTDLRIMDAVGRVVQNLALNGNEKQVVDLSAFAAGNYVMQFFKDGYIYHTEKLIKQ